MNQRCCDYEEGENKSFKLDKWSIVSNSSPYTAPEISKKCLAGLVYGHPKFKDGKRVKTSYIVEVKDRQVFTRSGSAYVLGDVDSKYEEIYPNAKEELFK